VTLVGSTHEAGPTGVLPQELCEALADPLLVVAGDGALAEAVIVYANPAAHEWAGRDPGTLRDVTLAQVIPRLVARADEAGLAEAVRRSGVAAQGLVTVPGATGEPATLELHVAPLGAGRALLQWRDVSHVRDIEAAHRAAEQQLSLVLAASGLGTYSWDIGTDAVRWNDAHFTMLGYAPGTIPATYEAWRSRVHPDDLARVENELRAAKAALRDFRSTYRIVRPDGAVRWVEGRGRVFRDADGQGGTMHGVMADVTEQRDIEAALRTREAELTAINESLERRVRERTAVAEERAEQLRQLALDLTATEARERRRIAQLLHDGVQQTISAAKMRAGMMRLAAQVPAVRAAAGEVEQLLDRTLSATRTLAIELHPPVLHEVGLAAGLRWLAAECRQKHELTVTLDVPEEEPLLQEQTRIVLFDAARELLFNIVKHAGVREAELALGTTPEGRVRVSVDDRGRGFEGSTDGDDAPRPGFGLANLEHRVRLLRGTVSVTSRRGHGTRIVLELPMDGPRVDVEVPVPGTFGVGDTRRPAAAAAADTIPARPRRRVLVADDHRLFREGVAQLLRDAGDFEVVGQADDGGQAVTLAAALRPDVCLLDVSMPTVNGVEAAMRISQLAPEVRVVALSMHERSDMADAMRNAGAVAYLSKDVPADVLLGVLRALG
jgi:PAS domain S-box-containing protein